MAVPSSPSYKRLHEMNRLEDMGHFPVLVHLGATANVLLEALFFYWLYGRVHGSLPIAFIAAVGLVSINLLPVVLLRCWEGPVGLVNTPPISQMSFVRDQHRFASWVYAVASGNLFFWLMLAWAAFDLEHSGRMLLGVELLALGFTFSPVLLRWLRGGMSF